jgi:8-oxo-dGTP diphosphatase
MPDQKIADQVVVFIFGHRDGEPASVALIRKDKPAWQKGRLNGVGGYIREGETSLAAAVRKVEQETGVSVEPHRLRPFCTLEGEPYRVYFYVLRLSAQEYQQVGTQDPAEPIQKFWLHTLMAEPVPQTQMIQNLSWLLPLALDPTVEPVGVLDREIQPTPVIAQR